MKHVIVPIFVPHMGCPHTCVFCNQYRITGQWQAPSLDDLARQVEAWTASGGVVPELAFYGGSFTAIALDVQTALLDSAASLKRRGAISAIRLSTRPDALDDEVLARLAAYEVDTVEIGVQSLDDEVLRASRRGHSALAAMDAMRRVKAAGFRLGAQLMVALSGDTPQKSIETARQVIALAPDMARIYPTAVIRDTTLAQAYAKGAYTPWPMDGVLDTVAEMCDLFEDAAIPVIRIGLQAEDNLSLGDVIAGAYHPALGELVQARRYRKRMAAMLDVPETAPVTFAVAPRALSKALGQHRENVRYLSEVAGQTVRVVSDARLQDKTIERR